MTITDNLREEATYTLSKYASLDMSNMQNKHRFCQDLFFLLAQWNQQGYHVMCDGRKDLVFVGMKLDEFGELIMCYEQI